MNCQEARRHWDLYYDSEGDAELHFQLNEHLAQCVHCSEWFDKQSRLESLIEARLMTDATSASASDADWSKIFVAAGVITPAKTRSWLFLGSSILALAATVLLLLGLGKSFYRGNLIDASSPSLSHLSAELHEHVSAGSLRPEFESRSDADVDQYLLKRVPFPVRCPPRKDSGFSVSGAGLCKLAHQQAAYVIGSVDRQAVSIFVLPSESLASFPRQREELRRESLHHCREGNQEMVLSIVDKNLVVVIGDVEPAKLERVLLSYGTYPHAS